MTAGSGPAKAADVVSLIATSQLAPLPVANLAAVQALGPSRYSTGDQYLTASGVDAPSLWRGRMQADHFLVGEAAGYRAGADKYGAEAFLFASHDGAEDFLRSTLAESCQLGYVSDPQALPGIPGGVAYQYHVPGVSPYNSNFVAGSTMVHLTICECVEAPDLMKLTVAWTVAVGHQVVSG